MKKNQSFRIEKDSLGEVKVPKKALWGAQTQRAIENFPISGIKFKFPFCHFILIPKSVNKLDINLVSAKSGTL